MKILVTGGCGFIGSHLVGKLIKKNKVLVIDDMSMGKLSNLPEHKNLAVISANILDDIGTLFEGIDTVYHLAALTRPRESFINPIATNRVNVEGMLNVLLQARKNNVKKFVFVSSASVYGYQPTFPLLENKPLNPGSPYALTKMIGELYCQLFGNGPMKINRIRPFNVYGPRQDPNGPYGAAVPKFIDALKTGKEPFITGGGSQFRDFIYVEDLVDLMIKVGESDTSGEVFNGGSGKHTSINTLYETISNLMKKKVIPKYIEEVDDPNTLSSVEKAEFLLGWRPRHSLVEGILKTI